MHAKRNATETPPEEIAMTTLQSLTRTAAMLARNDVAPRRCRWSLRLVSVS